MDIIVNLSRRNICLFRFFLTLHLLLSKIILGYIGFFLAVAVTMSQLEVIQLVDNDLVFAFDKSFKLFILGSDFVPQSCDDFIAFIFDGLGYLGKFVLDVLETSLKFLKQGSCLLSDDSIEYGRNAGRCLREEHLNSGIFSPIHDFALNFNDRFKHSLHSFLSLHLITSLDIARSQSFSASGMNHFDRIGTESFCHISRHMLLLDKVLIIEYQLEEFMCFLDHILDLVPRHPRLCHLL